MPSQFELIILVGLESGLTARSCSKMEYSTLGNTSGSMIVWPERASFPPAADFVKESRAAPVTLGSLNA